MESRLIGNSPAMQALRQQILHFAATDAAVLITGETGTGKEVIAQALHDFSPRKDGPFMAINAAALPEAMVEAELFGHEAGAFTGADKQRTGRIEAASGGVLFLDEIVSMPLALQPKLLRVLQEKKVDRIGGTRPVDVDIRLVSAANVDQRLVRSKIGLKRNRSGHLPALNKRARRLVKASVHRHIEVIRLQEGRNFIVSIVVD